jgi:hypothetical protein
MDMEIPLRTFNNLKKPDIVIFEKNRGDDDTHIRGINGYGKMLYIVEVKKFKGDSKQQNINCHQ